jgi:hypothetical protein
MGRREFCAFDHLLRFVIPEPRLSRLEAGFDRVARLSSVLRRVLARGTVTAPNVTTLSATSQVQPPSIGEEAFHAASATWLGFRVDTSFCGLHASSF